VVRNKEAEELDKDKSLRNLKRKKVEKVVKRTRIKDAVEFFIS
jgi:hypothetical protein